MIFRSVVFAAVVVGIISGMAYGVFQQLAINPIIYAAEDYELSEPAAAAEASSDGHSHSSESWTPEDGAQRILSTLGANILIAFGFAVLLIAAMALHNLKSDRAPVTWQSGILWGLGLMISFFVSPALLGLHPEVPGTVNDSLDSRQLWWLSCALATAAGLILIYYGPVLLKLVGFVLIVIPQVIGAPHPSTRSYLNNDPVAVDALNHLTSQFLIMTSIGMLIFFVLLGGLSGFVSGRLVRLEQ